MNASLNSLTESLELAERDALSAELQTGLAIFLCIALTIGVGGNLLTIIAVAKNKKLQTHSNVYVMNLAIVDILLLSVNLPTAIMEFFIGEDVIHYREYCKYTSPVNIMTMICALNSVAAVGFNRFLLLCKSKSIYHKFTRKSSIVLSLAIIWFWSFCIVLPPMFGYGEFGYHSKFRTCFFKANDNESWTYGTVFCCILGVFPPVLASSFFYAKILLKLAQNRRNLMRHYTLPPLAKIPGPNTDEQQSNNESVKVLTSKKAKNRKSKALLIRQHNHQRRSAFMLITIFVVIVICWLPISLSFMADRKNTLPSLVYVSFVILAWLNSCVNIFIYAGMNLQFRRAYVNILSKPFRRFRETTTYSSGSNTKAAIESQTESKT